MLKNTEVADRIRQTAYFLWEQDGRPEGQAFHYWLRAKENLLRELAYDQWLAEGAPLVRQDEIWRDVAGEIAGK